MINIFQEAHGTGTWSVWTDPEGLPLTGHCIGVGKTEKEAIEDAMTELGEELAQLRLTWEAL